MPGIDSGTADLFRREGGLWTHVARLLPSDGRDLDQFGIRVAIDGDTVVAGAVAPFRVVGPVVVPPSR